jgi:hypothetical protein
MCIILEQSIEKINSRDGLILIGSQLEKIGFSVTGLFPGNIIFRNPNYNLLFD